MTHKILCHFLKPRRQHGGYLDAYQCRRGCPVSGRISCIRCMHPQGGVRAQPSHHPAPTAGNLALNTNNWFLITFEGDQFRYHHYLHLDTTCTRNEIQHTIDHGLRTPLSDIQAAQHQLQTGMSDIAFHETRCII